MADGTKKTGSALPSSGLIVAALAVVSALFFARDQPFVDSRPSAAQSQQDQATADQDVEARLWQDPFHAVNTALERKDKGDVAAELRRLFSLDQSAPDPHEHDLLAAIDRHANEKTLVLGVMFSGASYATDAEFRRRTRYAVLAGLNVAGFKASDPEHLGYFKPPPDKNPPQTGPCYTRLRPPYELPSAIPYEWFEKNAIGLHEKSKYKRVAVLYLDEDIISREQESKCIHQASNLSSLISILNKTSNPAVNISFIGPAFSSTLSNFIKLNKNITDTRSLGV
jgi:hypothetical protein